VIIVVKGFWTIRDNIYEYVITDAKVMLVIDLVPSGYYNDVSNVQGFPTTFIHLH
jgi:hypothetical protein